MSELMGPPILIPGPVDLWLLAHITPEGRIQPTFYNFATIAEGLAFCAEHGERPAIELEGRRITARAIRLLLAFADGARSISAAARAAQIGQDHARAGFAALEAAGWVARGRPVTLTPAGLELTARMRAA